jgi:hypothetical protein
VLLLALCVAGWIWVEREENSGLLLVHSARKGKLLVDLGGPLILWLLSPDIEFTVIWTEAYSRSI